MNIGQELRCISDKVLEAKYQGIYQTIRKHLLEQAKLGQYQYSFSPNEPIRESILSLLVNEFEGVNISEYFYDYAADGYYYYVFSWKGAK